MTAALADPESANSAPGNPLNAPGSPRRRKAKRAARAQRTQQRTASRNLNELGTQEEREAELQRRRQAAAAKGSATPAPSGSDDSGDDQSNDHNDDDTGDAGGRFAPFAGMQAPATGGGFVLGLIGWALFRAYIGNPGQPSGAAGVRRLLAAKFLNKTS